MALSAKQNYELSLQYTLPRIRAWPTPRFHFFTRLFAMFRADLPAETCLLLHPFHCLQLVRVLFVCIVPLAARSWLPLSTKIIVIFLGGTKPLLKLVTVFG